MILPSTTKALVAKVVQAIKKASPVRTMSSISCSTSSHIGDVTYRPFSSLHEAVYSVDLGLTTTEDLLDPCNYGYRVVSPPLAGFSVHTEASHSLNDSGLESFDRAIEDFDQQVTGSHYEASFRPMVMESTAPVPLTLQERWAVLESQREWDAQLMEETFLRKTIGCDE
jgi:hypothetical protein